MLDFLPEIIKSPLRNLLLSNKIVNFFIFKQYKEFYRSNPGEFIVLQLPQLANYSATNPKDLYYYYWFAENIQYYKFPLKKIESKDNGEILKVLYTSNFGILPLEYSMGGYFNGVIKSAERALIRKSIKNGYHCKQIRYDDYLDDILAINKSKEECQGHAMSVDYLNIVKRDSIAKEYNPYIYTFGSFNSQGKLIAYYMFEKFTNFIHVNKGIGHFEHLNMGVMNHLFAHSLCELSKIHEGLYLIYGTFDPSNSNGLVQFKKHVGCKRKTLVYQGTKEQFNALTNFLQKYTLHGDSGLNYIRDYLNT